MDIVESNKIVDIVGSNEMLDTVAGVLLMIGVCNNERLSRCLNRNGV